MTEVTPRDIRRRIGLAEASLSSGVGIALGMWEGRGDWATLRPEGRANAARRALAELDNVLTDLTAARADLASVIATLDIPSPDVD